MRTNQFSFLGLSLCVLIAAASTFGQGWSFSDPNVDFSFDLPDAKWKLTLKPNATSTKTELVFGDRRAGLLEVRKVEVQKADSMTEVITSDEQKHRQFLQGYVTGKVESFSGRLRGSIANFEYVAGGRNMSGRYYFLRAGDTTVYVLRFTGPTDGLRSLRVQTDQIARTFRVKTS
jgi:hypothetical protein